MKQKTVLGFAALSGMLLLILDSSAGLAGASEGIQLCINVVIPSLFPFFFLSAILRSAFSGSTIRPLQGISRKLGIPSGYESILFLSFLGGYPVGAQTVAAAWKEGGLQTDSAKRLLAFCSNAGPAFIFGMLSTQFHSPLVPWFLWGIHIFSALIVGFLMHNGSNTTGITSNEGNITQKADILSILKSSIQVMSVVCGWVVLFRMLIAILNKWAAAKIPGILKVAVAGVLELTNGCTMLTSIPSVSVRFILCSALLAFGGICICLQTASIVGTLGIKSYIDGKILQSLISIIISWVVCLFLFPSELNLPWPFPLFLSVLLSVFIFFTRRKNANRCGNSIGCDV